MLFTEDFQFFKIVEMTLFTHGGTQSEFLLIETEPF